jgi:recombinational DNA repair protein RecR
MTIYTCQDFPEAPCCTACHENERDFGYLIPVEQIADYRFRICCRVSHYILTHMDLYPQFKPTK